MAEQNNPSTTPPAGAGCLVCRSPKREDIERELQAEQGGMSLRQLEDTFNVSRSALSRHRRACMGVTAPAPPPPPRERPAQPPRAAVPPPAPAPAPPRTAPPAPQPQPAEGRVFVFDDRPDQGKAKRKKRREDPDGEGGDGELEVILTQDRIDELLGRAMKTDQEVMALEHDEDRAEHIADLIVMGRWEGRETAKRLAALWEVEVSAVISLHATAVQLVRAGTGNGDREALRQASLAQWQINRDVARTLGRLKEANTAQAGWDRAAGVTDQKVPLVQINLAQNPAFLAVVREGFMSLERFPGAQEAFMRAIKRALDARRVAGVDGRTRVAAITTQGAAAKG